MVKFAVAPFMAPNVKPSGQQFEIAHGDRRAVVTEVGATLREYSVGPERILDGFSEDDICSGGRGQLLAPWPNRIRDGFFEFAGENNQLPINEVARHNAIHGLVRWLPWRPLEQKAHLVRLAVTLPAQPGYPFTLGLEVAYEVGATGLRVKATARNLSDRRAPYGFGQHPYLSAGTELVDDLTLTVPARSRLVVNEGLIPTGQRMPADFQAGRRIGDLALDTAFTDLEVSDGIWHVQIEGRYVVRLWGESSLPYVQLFSGDTLPPGQRRRGLAVEPMSCPANAFQTGEAVIVLEPGGEISHSWGLQP